MKAIDVIIMVCVTGLLALPLYMIAVPHSPAWENALFVAWAIDSAICFIILFWETFKKS